MHRFKPTKEQTDELLDGMESACVEAARLIAQADVFLLCTGAGFSADSGLAVYADVARVPAYAERGLEYHDICQPGWLESEPDLFWGFWGQCFNDYRGTTPHEGYEIIENWVDQRFRHSAFASTVRETLSKGEQRNFPHDPYAVTDHAGAFFVFTSNVDAHHFDWFRACEIRECHGNTELYQCQYGGHKELACANANVWRAPLDFQFDINKTTMLAPALPRAQQSQCAPAEDEQNASGDEDSNVIGSTDVPRIGNVGGGGRPRKLLHMPGCPPDAAAAGFSGNHPKCPECGRSARPAILMFGDWSFCDVESQRRRWDDWRDAIQNEIKKRTSCEEGGEVVRVVILELGAGRNVPTVRRTAESNLEQFKKAGADVHLIRVNPDFPLADRVPKEHVISIMSRGLKSLHNIDAAMQNVPHGIPRAAAKKAAS